MSRVPQSRSNSRPTSAASSKSPATPSKATLSPGGQRIRTQSTTRAASTATPSTPRVRTQSTSRSATPSKPKAVATEQPPPVPATPISIRQAIALKRAEAKKAQSKCTGAEVGAVDQWTSLEDAIPDAPKPEEEDLLGRLSIRDTIERARNTGSLNLTTRSLPCLPSALFEIHLNITPDPLKLVPNEPVLPPSEPSVGRRGRNHDKPTWFEAQDLTVLKAWNNEIQEIQHEISLFGSLKTVDLHKNKLTSLPNTFADLTVLTVLDLSHNVLTAVPENVFALPELTTLNLSHNQLTCLPFNAPFKNTPRNQSSSVSFFTPVVARSTTPLPRLVNLDVSHNKITAEEIHDNLPISLTKVDLSSNPLGQAQRLLRNLASLKRLKEVRFAHAEIDDDSFPSSLFQASPFPSLRLLDMEETQVHLNTVKAALKPMRQELNFDFVNDEPPDGVTRVLVGKRVIKEAWEIELERRAKTRVVATVEFTDDWTDNQPQKCSNGQVDTVSLTSNSSEKKKEKVIVKPKEVQKETWEIEAEQGLTTEGGRRRARAAAASAAAAQSTEDTVNAKPASSPSPPPSLGLTNTQYFTLATQILRLPASAPPSKVGHARAFSVATPFPSKSSSTSRTEDLAIPTPTLPLSTIVAQPFANTLKVLILSNRRKDRSFDLPSFPDSCGGFLPCLEELDLEGCNLNDLVPITVPSELNSAAVTPTRTNESLIPMIAKLFPSLSTLNLSYNTITDASLTPEALSNLILVSPLRRGLRHLRLRGNRISKLDGFVKLSEAFKGHQPVPSWRLEELDVRDNEIGKLPPELGLLALDVFLVDGNTFRVPQRRIWEREGTKGLLSWLRGRIDESL